MDFPTALDTFVNPTALNTTAEVSHSEQHSNANDAIEALEAKVGIDSSADVDSLDYKVTTHNADTSNPHSVTADQVLPTQTSNANKYLTTNGTTASWAYPPSGIYTTVGSDADCDYVTDGTDDDVQIQAAIDAVGAAGGGTVFIKAGTYVIGTRIDVDATGVSLIGEGMGATIIQAKTALTTGIGLISLGATYTNLSHLTIDGNKANQTTENHDGVYVNFAQCRVSYVEIKNLNSSSGTWGGLWISVLEGTPHIVAEYCYIHDNEGLGIQLDGNGANDENLINFCHIDSNTGDGVVVYSNNNIISKNHIINNGGVGIRLEGSVNIIEGNHIENNTDIAITTDSSSQTISGNKIRTKKHGIYVNDADNFTVTGNNILGIDLDADNTYSGIYLVAGSTRNVITGNRISDLGTNDFAYGIREASSTADYNNITGNIVDGAQTAQISRQGVNTDVSHNITS